jgi:hypothetical protein
VSEIICPGHALVDGRRNPATPERKYSTYELHCECGQRRTGRSWDEVFDLMLLHKRYHAVLGFDMDDVVEAVA